jgi:hypothetical protein
VRLAQYVKFREEKFGGVLFETRSEKVFTLNPTATAVIREIASGDEATIAAGSRTASSTRATRSSARSRPSSPSCASAA